ncbi:muscular LMNA-interacting protein isoform X13 [Rattus norvegicus]|uniref:muscular LMNA-interacting protein isoform X13 n=1 Tax=Rattus norvegicus TaxID=10116 RepID=UPI002FD7BBC6
METLANQKLSPGLLIVSQALTTWNARHYLTCKHVKSVSRQNLDLSLSFSLFPPLSHSFNMEFEKHEQGNALKKNEKLEERVTVSPGDSEAKPLIFTFVPTLRRLPTHIQLADTSKFLVKIPEEPTDKNPETVNRFEYSDHMTFSCESKEERDQRILDYPSEVSGKNSQRKEFNTKEPQGMQKGDLFKAEYVFIVDSDGEDEATCRQGEQGPPGATGNIATRPKSLAISSSLASDVVRPKVRGVDVKVSSHPEIPHGIAPQQKHGQALDEPARTESNSKASVSDLPVELCFPAQLRQQTEELCATIDKVLQDSLSMHSSDSPSRPSQTMLGSETIKTPTTHPRAAGRETKYANLSSSSSTTSESQLTKPGVIRPVPIKSKLFLKKEEEVYEPNPFSKYLEDSSGLFSEQ